MEKITFVSLGVNPFWVQQTTLLVESLRAFGGKLSQAPCLILTPAGVKPLSPEFLERTASLNATVHTVEIEKYALNFPLGFLPFAAAEAEKLTVEKSELMAWILPDTLFISPPESFLLGPEKQVAYRPVHHSNIGSEFDQELDSYWSLVYRHCAVPEERVFPMTTCTRDKVLRPYINAGMLVVRPENGFMQSWMGAFKTAYQHDNFLPLLENRPNAIFLHQAVLSAVLLNHFAQTELEELPETVNFPLHLLKEYPKQHHPASLNELITCRYESIKELQAGADQLGVQPPLDAWLESQIAERLN